MLYQIGPVTVDVFPFNADEVTFEGATGFARHEVMGRRPPRENMGEDDERLTLTGQILPTKIGGQDELDALQGLRRAGNAVMVVRGDGRVMGWFLVENVSEAHKMIGSNGVGQVIRHEIKLVRADAPGAAAGASLLSLLSSLF
jgi:uncharacterized protein